MNTFLKVVLLVNVWSTYILIFILSFKHDLIVVLTTCIKNSFIIRYDCTVLNIVLYP